MIREVSLYIRQREGELMHFLLTLALAHAGMKI